MQCPSALSSAHGNGLLTFYCKCHLLLLLVFPYSLSFSLWTGNIGKGYTAFFLDCGINTWNIRKGAKMSKLPAECDGISDPIEKFEARNAALEKTQKSAPVSLLHTWAEHTHDSFHDFSPEESSVIRRALLSWYEKYRRKLPWRGDPPPYNGSTAKRKNSVKSIETPKVKGETDIRSFFSPKRDYESFLEDEVDEEKQKIATPEMHDKLTKVTAYGVWVSEIMLQQTRVEAVIPYYLKCK
jgi:hypothetical protein